MPHTIIAFGRDKVTNENVATMFAVVDVSPIRTLEEIKQIVFGKQQERMSRKAYLN